MYRHGNMDILDKFTILTKKIMEILEQTRLMRRWVFLIWFVLNVVKYTNHQWAVALVANMMKTHTMMSENISILTKEKYKL